ncbi:MAG: hypothetical protein EOO28_02320 [Comamonadaceae bacterium]|nr:MAG: hypothetical protein EOO28_02320 [Comamonadaceae bacterium]
MYLRAGVFSLALLMASRLLGLLRESVQAAAFGASGLGDAVIVMFTLPDLLVGILFSGALAYVLLPAWALQTPVQQAASQKKVAQLLLAMGLALGLVIWLLREQLVHALAPGLQGSLRELGAQSLAWSAAVLPLALLASLWVTRLQHERDFVGMYAGSLVVNLLLVCALLFAPHERGGQAIVLVLGGFLALAMLGRLAWLAWRLRRAARLQPGEAPARVGRAEPTPAPLVALPGLKVWLWAALSSGLLLVLPLMARSLASQGGEGALASFNYAWKLVELPLVLAIQLVASLAFPAITRTAAGSPEREKALQIAFILAWALACAAIAAVASFSLPLAGLLFGWGRMTPDGLQAIAHWSAIGIWSLLPQALMAVLMTAMATSGRMHVAVWAYAAGIAALALGAWLGLGQGDGASVMWMLNATLASIAVVTLAVEGRRLGRALPWAAMLAPLAVAMLLCAIGHHAAVQSVPWALAGCVVFGLLVVAAATVASPLLRGLLSARLARRRSASGQ